MKYRAYCANCSVKEIPILFVDRKAGKSKMSKKIFFEALLNIWKIRKSTGKRDAFEQFVKFGITGGLGTITNLFLFFIFADKIKFHEIPVSIGCFLFAGTQNYIINHKWSFAKKMINFPLSFKRWFLFLSVSSIGLLVNIIVMSLIIASFNLPYKFIAQAVGIAAGMIINFMFSKIFVFRSNSF